MAVVELKVQLLAPVTLPPAVTVRLVHVAVRAVEATPPTVTAVAKVTTPEVPVAPKPAVALPAGRL